MEGHVWSGSDMLVIKACSPYSSVVEHPLSKRKVRSSILRGGIYFCSNSQYCCYYERTCHNICVPRFVGRGKSYSLG